ncbi:Uncharacterized protein TCM_019178 [Theobroma cacao]|uniref:Uncharacterized protein n=1 Tax=Theobroma cacao TaxID=3641 RepID=A0A061EH14_THECC|nr:Uncharacterized protein TCM_019178 [Theobroma cacao]
MQERPFLFIPQHKNPDTNPLLCYDFSYSLLVSFLFLTVKVWGLISLHVSLTLLISYSFLIACGFCNNIQAQYQNG